MKSHRNKKYTPSYLIFITGFILSCLIFYEVKILETKFLKYKFKEKRDNYLNILNSELSKNIDILNSTEQLFLSSTNVEREEFRTFTNFFLKDNRKIKALSWIPLVKGYERGQYEELAKKDGYKNFKFCEIGKFGRLKKSEEKKEYYPVYYIEPFIGNEIALGFDLNSSKDRSKTILKSLETKQITGTSKIKLV